MHIQDYLGENLNNRDVDPRTKSLVNPTAALTAKVHEQEETKEREKDDVDERD